MVVTVQSTSSLVESESECAERVERREEPTITSLCADGQCGRPSCTAHADRSHFFAPCRYSYTNAPFSRQYSSQRAKSASLRGSSDLSVSEAAQVRFVSSVGKPSTCSDVNGA